MTTQDIAAITTVIYTGGTFLLWWVNRKTTRLLAQQIRLLQDQLNHQAAFNKVFLHNSSLDAHREMWLPIISNPLFVNLLDKTNPQGAEKRAGEFLGSILINQCARTFATFQHGFSDQGEFAAFSRDARYLFSFPLVKWRWDGVARYHSTEFVDFVQRQIAA